MIWHRCCLKQPSLFGPACCGREATIYDRHGKPGSVLSIRRNGCVNPANSNGRGPGSVASWMMYSARFGSARIGRN